MTRSCVATFHATYAVLKAEKLLKSVGVPVKMVPVPRRISSNCGIAVRFDCSRVEEARAALAPVAEDLEGIYRPVKDGAYQQVPEAGAGEPIR